MKKFLYNIRFLLYGWILGIIMQLVLYFLFGVVVDTIKEVTGFIVLILITCAILVSPIVKLDKAILKNK